jgi:hypothetical protein
MRVLALVSVALSLGTDAVAQTDSPLPPGKPAGVHQAVQQSTENAILIGLGVAGVGLTAILVANALKSSSSSATTTSP